MPSSVLTITSTGTCSNSKQHYYHHGYKARGTSCTNSLNRTCSSQRRQERPQTTTTAPTNLQATSDALGIDRRLCNINQPSDLGSNPNAELNDSVPSHNTKTCKATPRALGSGRRLCNVQKAERLGFKFQAPTPCHATRVSAPTPRLARRPRSNRLRKATLRVGSNSK